MEWSATEHATGITGLTDLHGGTGLVTESLTGSIGHYGNRIGFKVDCVRWGEGGKMEGKNWQDELVLIGLGGG
jgi:hypothetical protein